MFAPELHLLKPGQLAKPGVQDRLGLQVRELKDLDQPGLGLVLLADNADHLVKVEEGDDQAIEDMEPGLDAREPVAGPAGDNLPAVIQEGLQERLQSHHPWRTPGVQDIHVDRDPRLKGREPEQALHQHFGFDIPRLGLQHQPDVLGALIQDVTQQGRLARLDEVSQLLDQVGLLHLIGNLGDDNAPEAAPQVLALPAGTHPYAAPSGLIGLKQAPGGLDDHAPGGKVRARDQGEEFRRRDVRLLENPQAGLDQLGDIVWRDGGRHAHRNAARTVGQEVREACRQDDGLFFLAVIGFTEIDRVLVDPLQQQLRRQGEPALRVPHGGRVIAVDIAEVPLPVHEGIALGEVLGEADQGLVDGGIPMGMILADHVADDAGALLGGRGRIQPQLAHGEEQPPMDGLQAVAHIRQGPARNGRQGIGQVPPRQGLGQWLVNCTVAPGGRSQGIGH